MNTFKEKMMFAIPVATIAGSSMVAFAEDTNYGKRRACIRRNQVLFHR